MSGLDFRKEIERKLWIFIIILSSFLLIVLIWGAVENTMGITIQTHETTTTDDWGADQPQRTVTRGPDNILRHVYPAAQATAVNLSCSSDNGTSWTETQIFAAGYQGATNVLIRGIVCTSNNTTIVLLTTTGAAHTYDVYLLVRWGWYGSWEINQGWGQNSYSYGQAQLAINNTDIVLIMFQYNMGTWYGLYRPGLHSFFPAATMNPTQWNQGGGSNLYPFIEANLTGKFWASFIGWDGSNYCIYYRDICATKALIKTTIHNLLSCYMVGMECVPVTGDMIFAVACNYTAYNSHSLYFVYHRNNKAYTQGPGWLTGYAPEIIKYETTGMTVDATGMVEIWWYSETAHKVRGMRCRYTEPLAEWSASVYDVNTGYTSTDYVNIGCGVSSLWPQICGVSVSIPLTGYFQNWIWKDEKGAIDDYNYQVVYATTVWPYIFWAPPVIDNYTLPNWYESEPYLHDFSISSGNTPYVWWITWNIPSDGGWFLGDSNGTMYGYCPASTGTYSITVHVTDFYGLTTTRTTSLTVLSRSTGGTGGTAISWDWPAVDEQGELWMLLAVVSMVSCCLGLIKRFGKSKWLRRK